MATAEATRMTVEEFLAISDDGVRRALIDGEILELGMTIRRWRHAMLQSRFSRLIENWMRTRPLPWGAVVSGEAGFRLSSGTMVGLDVAFVSPDLVAATPESQAYFDGEPTLAVEILSPSDKVGDVDRKVEAYLAAGVPLVWVVHPRSRTITAYRPDTEPHLSTIHDELDAEPTMPGFRVGVAEIFEI